MDLDFSIWIEAFRKLPQEMNTPGFWGSIAQIVWIDLLLAGDNALVIAMACRNLPPKQRIWGIVLGGGLAVLLRVVFALTALKLTEVPFLQVIGGVALIWIAIKLMLHDHDSSEPHVKGATDLWKAVWIIVLADLVMSLDNVIAIVGVSDGNPALITIGIALSIPMIFIGAEVMHRLLTRVPLLVWAGGLLLMWIAVHMILADKAIKPLIADLQLPGNTVLVIEIGAAAVAAFVLLVVIRMMRTRGS